MIKKKRINNNAIVVVNDEILSSTVDDERWDKICAITYRLNNESDELSDNEFDRLKSELIYTLYPEKKAIEEEKRRLEEEERIKIQERKRISKKIVDASDLFEYDEEGLSYLKGFNTPLNKMLLKAILDAKYNPNSRYTIDSLVNFTKLLMLNPDPRPREDLFNWLETGNFTITPSGFIVSYRGVDKVSRESDDLIDFVTRSYLKIKKQKKGTSNYFVVKDNDSSEYYLYDNKSKSKSLNSKTTKNFGCLSTLYENLPKNYVYKDCYTGRMRIRIGEVITMPRDKCDSDPNSSCSRGLHQKSSIHDYAGGSVQMVCLVNPMDVVAVPTHDTSKFRCCAYLPIGYADKCDEDGRIRELDYGTFDYEYAKYTAEELNYMLKEASIKEMQDRSIFPKDIDENEVEIIINNINDIVNSRVESIY